MNGVTILSEMSVRGESLGFVIAWILLTIALIVITIWDNIRWWRYSGCLTRVQGIVLGLIVCGLPFMLAIDLCNSYNTFHTEYKVTINDSVGFNEFTSNYEIVSSDGDVYTVIERTGY